MSQAEVAKGIGLSLNSGKGRVKNSSLNTILKCFRVCGASSVKFLKEPDRIDLKQRNQKMLAQLSSLPESDSENG